MHDGWGFPSLDSLLQDVRYGARILRRAPGVHRGRRAVALARRRRRGGGLQRRRRRAVPPAERQRSRHPARLPGHDELWWRGTKEVFGADHDAIDAMRKAADFTDLIGFRTIDDVALTRRRRRPHWCGRNWCRPTTSRCSAFPRQRDGSWTWRSGTVSGAGGHQRAAVARRTGRGPLGRSAAAQCSTTRRRHRRRSRGISAASWPSARLTSSRRSMPTTVVEPIGRSHARPRRDACSIRAFLRPPPNRRWRRSINSSDLRWRAPASCA